MRISSLLTLAVLLSAAAPSGSTASAPDGGWVPYEAGSMYLGAAPRIDLEPYDHVETNAIPLTVGWRPTDGTTWELRPVLDLQFDDDNGVRPTHFGAETAFHLHPWGVGRMPEDWLSPFGGPFLTGRTHLRTIEDAVTVGLELGAEAWSSRSFSVGLTVQPGVHIYTRTSVPGRSISPRLGLSSRLGWQF